MRVSGAGTKPVSLERLDEDGVAAIHEASMRVLEDLGVEVANERARSIFAEHGCGVDAEGVVTVPRDLVEGSVRKAPSEFTLHARNPDNDIDVGGDAPPIRAPGIGPRHVHTLEDGRREARLADYETLLKLAQVEDVVTCTGYRLCEPGDLRPGGKPTGLLERALTLTDKPVMGSARGAERAQACMDMVGIAMDDPGLGDPCVAGLVNTAPPRRIDAEMLDGLMTYAEHGQPPIVSSFTMAGASGPSTLAGSMVQTNAENLVGITLTQLVNPGCPVIYGVPSANVDPRYGSLSTGSPESALFVSFAARMGRHYDVPSRAGGALSDAKTVDYQSGFESAFLGTVTALSGVDFVLFAAGILESYAAISPEKFALDCEAIRHVDRFRAGYRVDGESLALDRMAETEPAGHFVGDPERDGRGDGFFRSTVLDKRSYEDWAEDGRKSAVELGHQRVRECLDAYERPPIDRDVERDLARYSSD
jgi:trimethylamine--corrinoid protein Co-methyltransferase